MHAWICRCSLVEAHPDAISVEVAERSRVAWRVCASGLIEQGNEERRHQPTVRPSLCLKTFGGQRLHLIVAQTVQIRHAVI